MILSLAPMEGITGRVFRRVHAECLGMLDRYYSPFIKPPRVGSDFVKRNVRELYLGEEAEPRLVPQLLTKNADEFVWAAGLLAKMGFDEEIFRTASVSEGMRTLSLRICDAFVCETFQGAYEMSKVRRYRYTIRQRSLPLQSYDRAIVVLRGNMELAVKIGHALREIKQSGRYTQILDHWLNDAEEYVFSPQFIMRAACAAVLLIVIMIAWNHALARKIRVTIGERERIFDFLREGILAVDAHGRITMLNSMARQLLDLSNDAFGTNADDLIPKVHFADANLAAIFFDQIRDIRKVVFTLLIVICEPKQSTK